MFCSKQRLVVRAAQTDEDPLHLSLHLHSSIPRFPSPPSLCFSYFPPVASFLLFSSLLSLSISSSVPPPPSISCLLTSPNHLPCYAHTIDLSVAVWPRPAGALRLSRVSSCSSPPWCVVMAARLATAETAEKSNRGRRVMIGADCPCKKVFSPPFFRR